MSYAELSRRAQIRRMRDAARAALTEYGLDDADLRMVTHEFNTTFRVTAPDGRRSAMRINVNSRYGPDEVAAEAEWVRAVATETDVAVPGLVPTSDGRPSTSTMCSGIDRPLAVVMYEWIEGRDLGEPAPLIGLEALGRSAAMLHDHGEQWRSPSIELRPFEARVLMDEPDRVTADARVAGDERAVIMAGFAQIEELTAPVFAGPTFLIHADLHGWNARWHGGTLTIFDFDDCGIGAPLHDLAISAFYLRDHPKGEAALLHGYETLRPLPDHTPAQWEALVASRALLLLNSVLGNVTADMAKFTPGYVTRTADRMRRYLDTGHFEL